MCVCFKYTHENVHMFVSVCTVCMLVWACVYMSRNVCYV